MTNRSPRPDLASVARTRRITRVLDVAIGLPALVVAAPFMALACLAVLATMGRPVVFRQTRSGLLERPFEVMKIRSMRNAPGDRPSADSDRARLTRVGRLLRVTSLDETPQLLNVLAGSMSIVGPRPLLPRYSACYTDRERTRFLVPPGITGTAQVSGRNRLSWDEKLALDAEFAERYSVRSYLRVLAATPRAVLRPAPALAWDVEQPLDVERNCSR